MDHIRAMIQNTYTNALSRLHLTTGTHTCTSASLSCSSILPSSERRVRTILCLPRLRNQIDRHTILLKLKSRKLRTDLPLLGAIFYWVAWACHPATCTGIDGEDALLEDGEVVDGALGASAGVWDAEAESAV